jgi:hypothetical protein
MTDDEALATYAGQKWTDPFPESDYAMPDDAPESEHENAAKKAEEGEAFDNL